MEKTQVVQDNTNPDSSMENQNNLQKEKDLREIVKDLTEQLDVIERSYFGKDKQRLLKTKLDEIISLLDTKPIDIVQDKKEKADLLYLRGKALDCLPEYSKNAEEYLSKSIKLMPSKYEAWDALGHVYWKKKDLPASKKCFEGSLQQNPNNKVAIRHLSMVIRMLDQPDDVEQKKKNFQESIQLAKKALAFDLNDSFSWYVLGNAHLTNFFTNKESGEELNMALKAYAQSEKLQKELNPDLYYNRGTIYEYMKRYNDAVKDYKKAHSIDVNLQADQRAEKIINLVTTSLIGNKNEQKVHKRKGKRR